MDLGNNCYHCVETRISMDDGSIISDSYVMCF
jgi:hypothetical protein